MPFRIICEITLQLSSKSLSFSDIADERETLTASSRLEREPLCFTAADKHPDQSHMEPGKRTREFSDVSHLFVPQTEIQNMISDILASERQTEKTKMKGPPPPVPKKPKNPFAKGAAGKASHAIKKPKRYSELLLQDIKLGRNEAAVDSGTEGSDQFPPDLSMLAFCPGAQDSPSYMCMIGGFDPDLDVPQRFPDLYGKRVTPEMDLWTKTIDFPPKKEARRMDTSQMRPVLETQTKIKGPPPPIPKKPQNPFAPIQTETATTDSDTSEGTAFSLKYERHTYKPYEDETMAEVEPSSGENRDNILAYSTLSSDSFTLDENVLLRQKPVYELSKKNIQLHRGSGAGSTELGENAETQTVKVSQKTKSLDFKKPSPSQAGMKASHKKGKLTMCFHSNNELHYLIMPYVYNRSRLKC